MILPPPLPIKRINHYSVWQLVLGITGICSYVFMALIFILVQVSNKTADPVASLNSQDIALEIWLMALLGITMIPSIIYAARELGGQKSASVMPGKSAWIVLGATLVLWAGLAYLGFRLRTLSVPAPLMVLLDFLVIVLPVIFWVTLASRGLTFHSRQRIWGVVNFSQFITSALTIIIEGALLVLALLVAFAWVSRQPEFMPYFKLIQGPNGVNENNIESFVSSIVPLMQTSTLYLAIAIGMCLFVPMIEEFFKPLAVWLFIGRDISPSEGFVMGLLCGAGFAFVESILMMGMVGSDSWLSTIIARAGTALLHITTAGISGWALARSWRDNKYWRISLVYLGAILLHGLWNFFALLLAARNVALLALPATLNWMEYSIYWFMGGLALIMVLLLVLINHRLQKDTIPPQLPVTIDQPESETPIL